jgi:hypothetical protein
MPIPARNLTSSSNKSGATVGLFRRWSLTNGNGIPANSFGTSHQMCLRMEQSFILAKANK